MLKIKLRQQKWSAKELLSSIDITAVNLPQQAIGKLQEFFWHDLCAEYDAVNLYHYLQCYKQYYSTALMDFVELWYQDELNHAHGFSQLYSMFYGTPQEEVYAMLAQRRSNFDSLETFLRDEFKLCVLFAYDELASAMTYQKDVFYKDFGHPHFVEWIKRVRADEVIHYTNAVSLIHQNFSERICETAQVLNEVLTLENNQLPYQGTFLFDHECPHFLLTKDELNHICVNKVLQKITKNKHARIH